MRHSRLKHSDKVRCALSPLVLWLKTKSLPLCLTSDVRIVSLGDTFQACGELFFVLVDRRACAFKLFRQAIVVDTQQALVSVGIKCPSTQTPLQLLSGCSTPQMTSHLRRGSPLHSV